MCVGKPFTKQENNDFIDFDHILQHMLRPQAYKMLLPNNLLPQMSGHAICKQHDAT